MTTPVLHVQQLTKRFGPVLAVQDLTLAVYPGELYGFLGLNGAGKTTTIRMMLGLLHPDAGQVYINGQQVTPAHNAALRQVGALLTPPGFLPYLSARDNLRWLSRGDDRVDDGRIDEVLDLVGLAAAAARRFGAFSLGMRQRLGLAAALLHRPRLLILDEPTNGLDPMGMAEMRRLLRDLADEGIAIFLSSHLLHEVQQVCDRVGILYEGRLITEKRIEEIRHTNLELEEMFLSLVTAEVQG